MEKSLIIIGAGIAGLSAGCYARMNGYRARIFERHHLPGGFCTSWKRGGYTFDGCIHHLGGSGPDSRIFGIWRELGALRDRELVFHDDLVRVETPDGRSLTVYSDLERLEAEMKALAPADRKVIDGYLAAARRFLRFDLLGLPLVSGVDFLQLLPLLPNLLRWMPVTMDRFALRFTDPFLRRVFPTLQYDFPAVPLGIHLNFLAGIHNRTLGWPAGGSLEFARAIARRFEELGGEVSYRAPVEKILVTEDRAVGVRLADGSEHRADRTVSAADGQATLFGMLEGRYLDDRFRRYYENPPDRQEMNLHVNFGVRRDLSREPHALVLFLERPLELAGRVRDRLDVEIYNFDAGLAPAGGCVLKVTLDGSYSEWKGLQDRGRAAYDAAKRRLADDVLDALEPRFPALRAQVEVVDVATPVTFERFTGSYRGMQAWGLPGAGFVDFIRGMGSTLPGLAGFHLTGQWVGGIGISTAAINARKLVQRICRADGRRFVTGTAETDGS